MNQLGVSVEDRPCVKAALLKRDKTNTVSMAMELPDGTIVDAKTSALLSAPAALILNALKALAGIKDSMMLISKSIIEPISEMKTKNLGNKNPRLHADEILVVLAISAQTNPLAEMAMKELPNLAHCQAHATVILPEVDSGVFKKLKIDVTTEAEFYAKKLYK